MGAPQLANKIIYNVSTACIVKASALWKRNVEKNKQKPLGDADWWMLYIYRKMCWSPE